MTVRELPPARNDVAETLNDALGEADALDGVIVIGLYRNGGRPMLRTSTMSGYEKAFCLAFLQAWFAKWLALDEA